MGLLSAASELASAGNTAAYVEDYIAEQRTHRHFDEAGVLDAASKFEDLVPLLFSVPMPANHSPPFEIIGATFQGSQRYL